MTHELWSAVQAEPRWLAIIGLGIDAVGGVMVALVAWMRVTVGVYWGGPGQEPSGALRRRRAVVVVGGSLLALGFGLQMWATYLQIPGAD